MLSPGAAPIRPPLPGIDLPGIFTVRTVPDVKEIQEWLEGHDPYSIRDEHLHGLPDGGAGQAGGRGRRRLHRPGDGRKPDPPRAGCDAGRRGSIRSWLRSIRKWRVYVERYMEKNGVRIVLNDDVTGFEQAANGSLEVLTKSGKRIRAKSSCSASACGRRAGWRRWPDWRSASAAASASTSRCAPATRISSPSATRSRSRTSSPANGRSSRWPGRPTGRAASRPK